MTETPEYAVEQLTAADLDGMSPEQIVSAKSEGRLDALIGVPPKPAAVRIAGTGQLNADDAMNMTPRQIVEAKAAGRFDNLLGIRQPYDPNRI